MTIHDPKTRHLTRDELCSALEAMRDSTAPEDEQKTTLMLPRARKNARRAPEPITELELRPPMMLTAADGRQELARTARGRVLPLRRRLIAPACLAAGVCFAGAVCWFVLRDAAVPDPRPVARVVASSSIAAGSTAKPIAFDVPTPQLAAPPSERAAVDLLVAGHVRDALDAYRALALHEPVNPAFLAVVAQLEWELSSCQKEGATCAQ